MGNATLTGAGWLVDEIDRQLVQYDAETQSLVSGDGATLIPVVGGLSTDNTLAAATANTTIIQNALNAGGLVQILAPGTYYVALRSGAGDQEGILTMYDDTHLLLGAKVIIKQFANQRRSLIRNQHYNSAIFSVSSITTAATGVGGFYRATATTGTAHDLSAGQWVLIKGDTSTGDGGNYNGVWWVNTVTSPTVFTFLYMNSEVPASASGTIFGAKANANITVEGGALDWNVLENTTVVAGTDSLMVNFNKVKNTWVRNQLGLNCLKYLWHFSNSHNCGVRDVEINSGSDGVHFKGPSWNCRVDGVSGQNADDLVAFVTVDVLNASINPPDSGGDILGIFATNVMDHHGSNHNCVVVAPNAGQMIAGVRIDGVHCSGIGYHAVGLYPNLTESGTIRDADIRNISGGFASLGSDTPAVVISGPSSVGTFTLGNISIDGVKPRGPSNEYLVSITGRVTFGEISIKNIKQRPLSLQSLILINGANVVGDVLNVEDARLDTDATNAAARTHIVQYNNCNVKRTRISRSSVNSNGGITRNGYFFQIVNPAANNRFEVVDSEVNAVVGQMAELSTITNAPTLYYRGITYNAASGYFQSAGESCTIIASDIDVIACVDIFIIAGTSKTVNFHLTNFRINGENFCTNYGTTNTLNWAGGDGSFRLNFDATRFTFASGSMFYNTNGAYGAGVGMYAYGAAAATRIAA